MSDHVARADEQKLHLYQKSQPGQRVSFWHDLPLRRAGAGFTFVNEIPKKYVAVGGARVLVNRSTTLSSTRAKMELSTKLPFNPIVQDRTKDNRPRSVVFAWRLANPRLTLRSSFYHSEILWNYGYIPQTIEDPEAKDALTGELGDGDPVVVVEIGAAAREIGSIREVCSLSVYSLALKSFNSSVGRSRCSAHSQ